MELRTSAEWQHGKSLKECNKYMLENEIATDVCFEVGPRDGHQGLVRAHKYILIARSAVFEAMFCGGMSESKADANSKIPITDVEVEIFEELLRWMCDYLMNIAVVQLVDWMFSWLAHLMDV